MTEELSHDKIILSLKGDEAMFAINQMALSKHGIFKETFKNILMDPKQSLLHGYAIDYFVSLYETFSQSEVTTLLLERLLSPEQNHSRDGQLIKALMSINPEIILDEFGNFSSELQKEIVNTYLLLGLYKDHCVRHKLNDAIASLPTETANEYLVKINHIISEQFRFTKEVK